MGNKLCKKKTDVVDNKECKSPTRFDRIINRLQLRPNAWKSESQLDQKQANRYEVHPLDPSSKDNNIIHTQPLSKSSDWTEVELSVPDHEDHIHLRNPKLSIIFNKESSNTTPVPPPRKHKKNFREKIEAVAKSGLQAFQSKKPVEEPLCVKTKINYKCPICDADEANHNRDHHHHHHNHPTHKHDNSIRNKNDSKDKDKIVANIMEKDTTKRKKNLSVISLPNYDELKLTVANFDDIDQDSSKRKAPDASDSSLPLDAKTKQKTTLDNYITRCRSFGSLLPQQLKKIRTHKTPIDIESDDSFGGLEDWDLGLIEHYNPKDASLPRPRKTQQKTNKQILSDIESLIVQEEDILPKPPVRRSESLVKKINREAVQSVQKPIIADQNKDTDCAISKIPTPPPSPTPKKDKLTFPTNLPTEENGHVEHSSLMKILEKFSILDKQETSDNAISKSEPSSNESSLSPSLLEFEKSIPTSTVEDFIKAEKINTDRSLTGNGVVS